MNAVVVTRWLDLSGKKLSLMPMQWGEFQDWLTKLKRVKGKKSAPLIKFARFGDIKTDKESLRHDANVIEITGVEGDYDAEIVTPDAGLALLEAAGIRAVIVTTHSHEPDKPRWRVFAPISKPMLPQARYSLVARLNGALRGVLAGESFTLSQSYFVGGATSGEYRVLTTFDDPNDGEFIDELHALDEIAIGKPKDKSKSTEQSDSDETAQSNLDDWLKELVSGESVHPSACRIVARMVAKGIDDVMIRYVFSILAEKVEETRGAERAAGLRGKELDDLIESARRKGFAPEDPLAAFARMKVKADETTAETINDFVVEFARLRKAGSISRAQEDLLLKPMAKRLSITVKALRGDVFAAMGGYDDIDHLEWARRCTAHIGKGDVIYTQTSYWQWNSEVWQAVDDRSIKQHIHAMLEGAEYPVTKGDVDCITDVLKTEVFQHDAIFDRSVWWSINVKNGTLDLREGAWTLREHRRDEYLTTQLPVEYLPGAECPRFRQFLDEVFDGDTDAAQKAQCIMEFIGYTLLTTCRYEKFIVLIGSGANGKSVLLGVVEALVCPKFVAAVQPSQFDNRFQRAHLHTRLANIVTEIAEGAEIADAQLKAIVSGELTTAEHKMRPPFDFRPFATCWFGTNHLPHTRDFSDALFRRAIVMTFNNKFEGADCDPHLKDRLIEELPGILVAALNAVAGVIQRSAFTMPGSAVAAARDWRNEADQAVQFIEEECQLAQGLSITSAALYKAYENWAESAGIRKPLGRKNFTTRLTRVGIVAGKGTGGKRMMHGITTTPIGPWDGPA
jgi:putative DNA primase/helicase